MFIHTIHRPDLRRMLTAGLLILATGVLLLFPAATSTGISRGLAVCTRVILPTLYPFMLLAGITANSNLCRNPGRLSCRLTRRLFGLPGCCGPAILLSLVGGYPAGIVAVAGLYRRGQIDKQQVNRMTAFCVGGGPGFIISTVGAGMLGNTTAGMLLFAAQVTVSVGIGILLGRGHRRDKEAAPLSPLEALPFSRIVGDTCGSLLSMCGFVVAAAMVLSVAEGCGFARLLSDVTGVPAGALSTALAAVLEVSCGCIALAGHTAQAPFLLSLCISWGGLSVHGQLAAALPEHRILTLRFWGWRLVHGMVSGGLTILLFRLFPPTLSVINPGAAALPYSVSAAASGMLLCLSFLAMLQFSEKKTGKTA